MKHAIPQAQKMLLTHLSLGEPEVRVKLGHRREQSWGGRGEPGPGDEGEGSGPGDEALLWPSAGLQTHCLMD